MNLIFPSKIRKGFPRKKKTYVDVTIHHNGSFIIKNRVYLTKIVGLTGNYNLFIKKIYSGDELTLHFMKS